MNKSLLKHYVTETGSHFFDRSTMRFFGDTMANYGVRAQPVSITTRSGDTHQCYELYRRNAVKHDLTGTAFFDVETFDLVLPAL